MPEFPANPSAAAGLAPPRRPSSSPITRDALLALLPANTAGAPASPGVDSFNARLSGILENHYA